MRVPREMQESRTESRMQWDLLESVLSLFIGSLPVLSHFKVQNKAIRRAVPLIRAQLELIGVDLLQDVQLAQDLSDDAAVRLRDAFDGLLAALEKAVVEDILLRQRADDQAEDDAQTILDKFPKLVALRSIELSGRVFVPAGEDGEQDSSLGPCSAKDYIRFGTNDADYQRLLDTLFDFHDMVEQIYSGTLSEAAQNPISSLEDEIATATRAQDFSKVSEHLFNSLMQQLEQCKCSKSGGSPFTSIRLAAFPQPQIEFLLPICSQHGRFHPVTCKLTSPHLGAQMPPMDPGQNTDLCHSALKSRKRQRRLEIHLDDESLREGESHLGSIPPLNRAGLCSLVYGDHHDCVFGAQGRSYKLMPRDRKRIAVLLARSMLCLYKSPWLQQPWDMEQLFIWPGRDTALHDQDPYLNCPLSTPELRPAAEAQDEMNDDTLSRHPLLLTFGLRLLEIESGRYFAADEIEDADFETNTVLPYLTLQRVLRTLQGEGSVEDGYLKVAQACLDFDDQLSKLHGIDVDGDTKYRIAIYRFVFLPLLDELRSRFAEAAADFLETEAPEPMPKMAAPVPIHRPLKRSIVTEAPLPVVQLHPERWQKHIPSSASPLSFFVTAHTGDLPTNMMLDSGMSAASGAASELFGAPPPSGKLPGLLALFDEKYEASDEASREVSYAEEFFDRFTNFRSRYMKPIGTRSRVKIAILDTGVDEQDLEFETRRECIVENRTEGRPGYTDDPVKAIESFVEGPAKDSNGHGTHVAGLVLRIAPDADIYIAKIADQLSIDRISHIPQAIRWAKEMGCDIITMSFGMVESSQIQDDLTAIEEAIKDADAAGILMFAAASNCGGNGSRTYPASDRHVICVHALDGHGYLAGGINPPTEHFSRDNFGTLGVAIPCSWRKKIVYKSGTSFATPIAAGIAANILDYLDYSARLDKLDRKKHSSLRQGHGLKQLFSRFMSTELAGCGYRFVAPWLLWSLEQEVDDEYIWSKLKFEYKLHG